MPFSIKCYNGNQQPGAFYIQSKGLHAGRPLKNPIANCFVVYTEDELLFSRVYALFVCRCFAYYIHGTAVPTIRIGDVRHLIQQAVNIETDFTKELATIHSIDALLQNLNKQITHYRALQRAISGKVNSAIVLK